MIARLLAPYLMPVLAVVALLLALYAGWMHWIAVPLLRGEAEQAKAVQALAYEHVAAANRAQEALNAYVQQINDQHEAVAAAADRARTQCGGLRQSAAHLSASARRAAGTSAPAQDGGDDEFAEAIASDLQTCAQDLARFRALIAWHAKPES